MWRSGSVHGWPRLSKQVGAWELLYLALESALGANRIRTARELCKRGQQKTNVRYAVGLSKDLVEFAMLHGPFTSLSQALEISIYDDDLADVADGTSAFIVKFDGPNQEIVYTWLDEWVSLT